MWNELYVFKRFSLTILKLLYMCVCVCMGVEIQMFLQDSCTQKLLFPLFIDAKHLIFVQIF